MRSYRSGHKKRDTSLYKNPIMKNNKNKTKQNLHDIFIVYHKTRMIIIK